MRLFLHLMRLSFQQQLAYRTAVLAGLVTNFFFALLKAAVLTALYHGQEEVNGLTLQQSITYIVLAQGLIAFLMIFGSWEVMDTVYNGAIGADLLRPVRLFVYWMARDAGRSIVNFVGRGLVLMAGFALFYPLLLPAGWQSGLMLIPTLLLAWMVSFAWRFLINLAAFWTPDARGFGRIAFTASQLLSGFIMPMRLYPDWFIHLCRLTPFPAMVDTTAQVYLGLVRGPELLQALLVQAAWAVILALLAQIVLAAGVRKLVIQGG
jgi:ABC-2 type transport system permease protein